MTDTTECKLSAENDRTPGERDATMKTGWQPMATCPSDGEQIWVYWPGTEEPVKLRQADGGWWRYEYRARTDGPQGWQPLVKPLPPEPTP